MKRSSVFILITLLLFSSCGIQKRVKKADKKFAIGEYYIAADMYKSCYGRLNSKKDRELKGYVAYKQGECYRLINNPRAANCYQSALRQELFALPRVTPRQLCSSSQPLCMQQD